MKCEIFKDRLEIGRMIEDIILNDTMGFVDYGNIRIIEREGVLRLAFKYSCKKNEPEFIDTIINAIAQNSSSKQAIKGCVLILQTKDTQGSIDVNDVSVLWNKIGAILGERVYNTFEFATKECLPEDEFIINLFFSFAKSDEDMRNDSSHNINYGVDSTWH